MPIIERPRVLIISHDVVGSRMAGPGIRYWEMARVLAAQQPVTLVAPQPIDLHDPALRCGSYTWGEAATLTGWLHDADVVVANGFVLLGHPELAQIAQPLALDLYDPTPLENLELFRSRFDEQRQAQHQQDVALLECQLAAGDFLICATERQRDLYIGALMAHGQIIPTLADTDPALRRLIDVVPFGLSVAPPVKRHPALRGVLSGIGADDVVLLWTGGLWDWMDPLILLKAMPAIVAKCPTVRLVFLAGQHPGHIQPMRMPIAAKALADELGLLNSHVFFYDQWVPYIERVNFLLEADLAIMLHHQRLEAVYAAVRSRFLDHLWAGLPSIISDGDAASALVQQHHCGRVVAPEDVTGLATAVLALACDRQERQQCREQAQKLAIEYTWDRVLLPLSRFCRNPYRMSKRSSPLSKIPTVDDKPQRNDAILQLDHLWQLQPRESKSRFPFFNKIKQFANTFIRWYVQPLVEQQNVFNAAVVHALQSLAHAQDQQQKQIDIVKERLEQLVRDNASLQQHVADMELHLCDIDDIQTEFSRRLVQQESSRDTQL
ncbi:MAG: glycosyltransferase family 4 protein [Chloroflexales bacterium]|nr:glycosyltransferase family 4 protein [Chloroflexales bacterium]